MPRVAAAKKKAPAPPKKPANKSPVRLVEEPAAEWVDIDDLVPWAKNPKPHEDVSHIVASMLKFGFGDPVVARKANRELMAGHGRVKAARLLVAQGHAQFRRVPVRFLDLAARDAHLYALAANKLAEKSPFDTPMLHEALREFSLPEAALAGWDSDELDAMAKAMAGSSGGDGDGEAGDDSHKAKTDFAVLIECDDEQEQLHVIKQCEELGLKCRALV